MPPVLYIAMSCTVTLVVIFMHKKPLNAIANPSFKIFLIFSLFEHPYSTSIPTTLVRTLNGTELYQINQYLKITYFMHFTKPKKFLDHQIM